MFDWFIKLWRRLRYGRGTAGIPARITFNGVEISGVSKFTDGFTSMGFEVPSDLQTPPSVLEEMRGGEFTIPIGPKGRPFRFLFQAIGLNPDRDEPLLKEIAKVNRGEPSNITMLVGDKFIPLDEILKNPAMFWEPLHGEPDRDGNIFNLDDGDEQDD